MPSRSDVPRRKSLVSNLPPRLFQHFTSRRMSRGRWLRLLAGATLPGTLFVAQFLPAHTPITPQAIAPTFALTSALNAFGGDAGVAAFDFTAATDGIFEGVVDWAAPLDATPVGRVNVDAANVRTGPGTSFESLGKLDSSTSVTLLTRTAGDWFQVRTPRGTLGWMSAEVLTVPQAVVDSLPLSKTTPAAPAARTSVVTTDSGINVRKGPGTEHASLTKLSEGVQVDLLAREGNWAKIQTANGLIGWVANSFLRTPGTASTPSTTQAAALPLVGLTTDNSVRLRGGPGTKYDEIAKLTKNTSLTLVAKYGDWYKVKTARGTVAWIAAELVSVKREVANRVPATKTIPPLPKTSARVVAPPSGVGSTVARVALSKVGRPYVWGGAGPRGFDCSGLLVYAYRQVGIYLPHKASQQFSSRYGKIIGSMRDLQAGDMVFFRNTAGRGITHAAMYVGGGMMVSANSPRTGVQYQSIYTRYWTSHWAGGVRPYKS